MTHGKFPMAGLPTPKQGMIVPSPQNDAHTISVAERNSSINAPFPLQEFSQVPFRFEPLEFALPGDEIWLVSAAKIHRSHSDCRNICLLRSLRQSSTSCVPRDEAIHAGLDSRNLRLSNAVGKRANSGASIAQVRWRPACSFRRERLESDTASGTPIAEMSTKRRLKPVRIAPGFAMKLICLILLNAPTRLELSRAGSHIAHRLLVRTEESGPEKAGPTKVSGFCRIASRTQSACTCFAGNTNLENGGDSRITRINLRGMRVKVVKENIDMKLVEPSCSPAASTVFVGRNRRGKWVAREQNGNFGGLFVNRAQALKYALHENGRHAEAVVEVAHELELDIPAKPQIANA